MRFIKKKPNKLRQKCVSAFPVSVNRNSVKYVISEEDSSGLLQLHIGATFLRMMMAIFIEKENSHSRCDQIYDQTSHALLHTEYCFTVVPDHSLFN